MTTTTFVVGFTATPAPHGCATLIFFSQSVRVWSLPIRFFAPFLHHTAKIVEFRTLTSQLTVSHALKVCRTAGGSDGGLNDPKAPRRGSGEPNAPGEPPAE